MESVRIVHIHSAGNYIISRSSIEATRNARKVIQVLEEHQFGDNTQFEPLVNQTVSVYNAVSKKWLRAQVIGVNQATRDCLIRYTFSGCTDTVAFLATHPVPADIDVERISAHSIQVTLAHIYPVEEGIYGDVLPLLRWRFEPSPLIQETFLERASPCMYQNTVTVHGYHFGQLHLRTAVGLINIADNLVQTGRAMKEDNWLEHIESLKPEVLSRLTGGYHIFTKDMFNDVKRRKSLQKRTQRSRLRKPSERDFGENNERDQEQYQPSRPGSFENNPIDCRPIRKTNPNDAYIERNFEKETSVIYNDNRNINFAPSDPNTHGSNFESNDGLNAYRFVSTGHSNASCTNANYVNEFFTDDDRSSASSSANEMNNILDKSRSPTYRYENYTAHRQSVDAYSNQKEENIMDDVPRHDWQNGARKKYDDNEQRSTETYRRPDFWIRGGKGSQRPSRYGNHSSNNEYSHEDSENDENELRSIDKKHRSNNEYRHEVTENEQRNIDACRRPFLKNRGGRGYHIQGRQSYECDSRQHSQTLQEDRTQPAISKPVPIRAGENTDTDLKVNMITQRNISRGGLLAKVLSHFPHQRNSIASQPAADGSVNFDHVRTLPVHQQRDQVNQTKHISSKQNTEGDQVNETEPVSSKAKDAISVSSRCSVTSGDISSSPDLQQTATRRPASRSKYYQLVEHVKQARRMKANSGNDLSQNFENVSTQKMSLELSGLVSQGSSEITKLPQSSAVATSRTVLSQAACDSASPVVSKHRTSEVTSHSDVSGEPPSVTASNADNVTESCQSQSHFTRRDSPHETHLDSDLQSSPPLSEASYVIEANRSDILDSSFEPKSYLNVCKPVVHTVVPLRSNYGDLAPGDMETRLHHYIRENSSFPRVSLAQVSSVPAILEHRNTCVVHSLQSQYHSAYLGSLLSLLIQKKYDYYRRKSLGIEPLVLILAPSSIICEELYSVALRFLSQLCDVTVKTIYGSSPENEKKALFSAVNGCDVLITTPRCLYRLWKSKIIGLYSVYHCVLERADVLFEKFFKEVMQCLQFISQTRLEKFASRSSKLMQCPELQIIVSSEIFNKKVEHFVRNKMTNPVLIFSNFLEAAVYGKVNFHLTLINAEDRKLAYLLETLQKHEQSNAKVAILCETSKEVLEVHKFLATFFSNLFAVHASITIITVHSYMSRWSHLGEHNEFPILIISDEVMCNVFAEDVTVLIHYSLPTSKAPYLRRFKLVKEALVSMFDDSHRAELPKSHCHLILDKNNEVQLHEILCFSQRVHLAIPPKIMEIGKQIKMRREAVKHNAPVCLQLLMFGKCELGARCASRHALVPSLDSPLEHVPRQGLIKFNILSVLDATHFTIKILETRSSTEEEWQTYKNKVSHLKLAMRSHYAKQESQTTHYNPSVGDIVALQREHVFIRARVVELRGVNESGEVTSVRVKMCDSQGKLETHPVSKLYTVPAHLKCYPDQVVNAFVTRVLPIDEDVQWNADTTRYIDELVEQQMRGEKQKYFLGKIVLALNNTLWLDPFQCMEYLPISKTQITHFGVRDALLSKGRAVPHAKHLELLYTMCGHIEGAVPEYANKANDQAAAVNMNLPVPRWAHLNREELNNCVLIGIVSPSLFFLRLVKMQETLALLHRDIAKHVERTSSRYVKETCFPGLLCLARSSDQSRYNRVQVNNTDDDQSAMVLFVDYSDTQEINYEDLLPIHRQQVISNLPFQMIECSLSGLEPTSENNGQWSNEAYEFMDEYTRLFVKVVSVDPQSRETGGSHYSVELFDLKSRVNLNKELVVLQLAKYSKDANEYLSQDDDAVFNQIERMMENVENEKEDEEVWEDLEENKESNFSTVIEKEETAGNEELDFNPNGILEEDLQTWLNDVEPDYVAQQDGMLQALVVGEPSKSIPAHLDENLAPESCLNLPHSKSNESNSSVPEAAPQSNYNFTLRGYGELNYASGATLTPLPNDFEIDPDMPSLKIVSYPARTVWYQSDGYVHIHFHVPGLHDQFTCEIHEKLVHFYVTIDDRLYENQLPLLCYVIPDDCLCEWNGFELRLKLRKQMGSLNWPCLLEDNQEKNSRWLHYHVDHLSDDYKPGDEEDESDIMPGPPTTYTRGAKANHFLSDDEDMTSDSDENHSSKVPEDF